MSDVLRESESDLAYLKALVDGDPRTPEGFGAIYALTGLIYGSQVILGWLQITGEVALSHDTSVWANIGFSIVYVLTLVPAILYYRRPGAGGVASRTFSAAFVGVGCGALTTLAVLVAAAWRLDNPAILQLIPAIAFALQGAGWLAAWTVRRRAWFGFIAFGWFVAAIGCSLSLGTAAYVLVIGLALLFLMLIPGVAILYSARQA